jgi:hypothetical protein
MDVESFSQKQVQPRRPNMSGLRREIHSYRAGSARFRDPGQMFSQN